MNPHYFSEALAHTLQHLGMMPEEFAQQTHMTAFEVTHLLAGEPLPVKSYGPIFEFVLANPKRARFALTLARGCLVDGLVEAGVEAQTAEQLAATTVHQSAIEHLFNGLSIATLLALSTVGHAARRNDAAHNGLMSQAELCLLAVRDRTIPPGYFAQQVRRHTESKTLLGGSIGDLAAELRAEHSN